MAITAQKIAELAGVSRGTVDRALKNRTGVNPETKEKILEIAKKYNYKPNLIGKALVYSNRSVPVAVIMNSIGNSFFEDVKKGMLAAEREYSDYGIKLNIKEIKGYNACDIIQAVSDLPEDQKNVILTPVEDKALCEKIDEMTDSGINVITLSSDISDSKRLTYVGCDYLKSGETAGRLVGLLSGGNAKLCIVTGSSLHNGHRMRVQGVQNITHEYENISIVDVIENNDDNDRAYSAMKDALQRNEDIDFVCITAGGVTGTLKAIKESGRNIKVCSFDDTETTRKAMQNGEILATICQQPYEQGYNAVKSIFEAVVAKTDVPEYQYSQLYIKVDKSL